MTKSIITRCKHCGREYAYHLSGLGLHSQFDDRDYCLSCRIKIGDILATIPKKYVSKYKEVPIDEKLRYIFKKLYEKEENDGEILGGRIRVCVPLDYDYIELYIHDGKTYALCTNDGNTNSHLFLLSEFDIQKNDFTGKAWITNLPDSYRKASPMCRRVENFKVDECKLSPPIGDLGYKDLVNN